MPEWTASGAVTDIPRRRRCRAGCRWRGTYPTHDVDEQQPDYLVRFVTERPNGPGRTDV